MSGAGQGEVCVCVSCGLGGWGDLGAGSMTRQVLHVLLLGSSLSKEC
jgi:hypothetical protein